jgi:GDP-mannose transporter
MADDKKRDDYAIEINDRSDAFKRAPSPVMRPPPRPTSVTENAMIAILSYCGSSILMTVTNKYVLSGVDFNLNFFLLCVQVRPFSNPQAGFVDTRYSLLSV